MRDSDITAEVVEQLKQAGPKISGIIEANGEGDAGMLEALFKVKGFSLFIFSVRSVGASTGFSGVVSRVACLLRGFVLVAVVELPLGSSADQI